MFFNDIATTGTLGATVVERICVCLVSALFAVIEDQQTEKCDLGNVRRLSNMSFSNACSESERLSIHTNES